MSITISGSTGISGVDGSSTTPAFQGTDTNTGLFYGTDIVGISTGGSERVRVDSNGNVGIGTTSPSYKLQVYGASNPEMRLGDATVTYQLYTEGATAAVMGTVGSHALVYRTNATERMRIDSSGNVLVGTTSPATGFTARLNSATTGTSWAAQFENNNTTYDSILCVNHATSGNNRFIAFATEAGYTERGFIDYNRTGNAVRYNTTSDKRLKENIQNSTTALPIIEAIKIRAFDWKESKTHVSHGVIAQELKTIVPDAISEGDDNEEISKIWGVDTSVLVPYLVKAIQEQQTIINDLKARVTALEAKIV